MTFRRIVVTGAQGLLGRHVVAELLHRPGVEVLGVGRSPASGRRYTHQLRWAGQMVPAPLPRYLETVDADSRYRYHAVNVGDPVSLRTEIDGFGAEVIVHAAAALRDDPLPALISSNIEAVAGIMEAAARSAGRPRVVNVSSGSVYGPVAAHQLPIDETTPCLPSDLYAVSKRAGEDVARVMARQHGVWLAQARVFNLLGPGLQDRHLAALVTGQVGAIALGLVDPLVTTGRLASSRDFIDVRDAASAVVCVAASGADGQTYNVASGREVPTRQVVDLIVRLAGLADQAQVREEQARQDAVDRSVADIRRLCAIGWAPTISLEESLTDMLAYYRELVAPGAR